MDNFVILCAIFTVCAIVSSFLGFSMFKPAQGLGGLRIKSSYALVLLPLLLVFSSILCVLAVYTGVAAGIIGA